MRSLWISRLQIARTHGIAGAGAAFRDELVTCGKQTAGPKAGRVTLSPPERRSCALCLGWALRAPTFVV